MSSLLKDSDVKYIPCSGLTGENLIEKAKVAELVAWYKGSFLTAEIGKTNIIIVIFQVFATLIICLSKFV